MSFLFLLILRAIHVVLCECVLRTCPPRLADDADLCLSVPDRDAHSGRNSVYLRVSGWWWWWWWARCAWVHGKWHRLEFLWEVNLSAPIFFFYIWLHEPWANGLVIREDDINALLVYISACHVSSSEWDQCAAVWALHRRHARISGRDPGYKWPDLQGCMLGGRLHFQGV